MSLINYPKSVLDFGFKHRRQFSYKCLPQLYSNLLNAQMLLCEFYHFLDKIKEHNIYNVDFSDKQTLLETLYFGAWLEYYGIDAKEHLERYYNKRVVEWLRQHLQQF